MTNRAGEPNSTVEHEQAKILRLKAKERAAKEIKSVFKPSRAKSVLTDKGRNGKPSYRVFIGKDKNGKQVKPRFGDDKKLAEEFLVQWNEAFSENDNSALSILDDVAEQELRLSMIKLKKVNSTVKEATEFFLRHALPDAGIIMVEDAIEKYYEIQKGKGLAAHSSDKGHKNYGTYAKPFLKFFTGMRLIDVTLDNVKKYIGTAGSNWGHRTINDHVNYGARVWNVLADSKYCSKSLNPFEHNELTRKVQKKRGYEKLLPVNVISEYFRFTEKLAKTNPNKYQELAHMTISFFCFIRVEETGRAHWDQIKKDQKLNPNAKDSSSWTITVWGDQEKTNVTKINPIPENAKYFLELCEKHNPKGQELITKVTAQRMQRHRAAFRKWYKAKTKKEFEIPQNLARHMACTCHLSVYEDYPLTVKRLAHGTAQTMRDNYQAILDFKEGEKFYQIFPHEIEMRKREQQKIEWDSYWKGKGFKSLKAICYYQKLRWHMKEIFMGEMRLKNIPDLEITESLKNNTSLRDSEGNEWINKESLLETWFVNDLQNTIDENRFGYGRGGPVFQEHLDVIGEDGFFKDHSNEEW